MPKRLSFVLIVSALMVLTFSQAGSAAIARNTIDQDASLSKGGRSLVVTGPIECTAGDSLRVELTVTQASTNAYAKGSTRLWCTGELQQWTVNLHTRGRATLEEGAAEVCAFAFTRQHGTITDTRQWCADSGILLQ